MVTSCYHAEGYATEAIEIMIEYGFNQLNYHKIHSGAHEDNKPSRSMLEKIGFKQEGRLREHVYLQGEHKDLLKYGMLKQEWVK